MDHFADRLTAAVRAKGNAVCVGLDPRWDALPQQIRNRHDGGTLEAAAMAVEEFCLRVVDLVAPLVPVVKPQSAFFEAFGPDGMRALQAVLRRAREQGLLTILDAKRNDIASTATAYAEAAFGGTRLGDHYHPVWNADALTVNPYLGRDSVEPKAHGGVGGAFLFWSGQATGAPSNSKIWTAGASRSTNMLPRQFGVGPKSTWATAAMATWALWWEPLIPPKWPPYAGPCLR